MQLRIYGILSYSKSEIYTSASINDKYLQCHNEIEIEITLKIGIVSPQFGQPATKENIVQTAKTVEQEDIDSLWVEERLLWPVSPQTPYPGSPDGSLPVESQIVLDPLGKDVKRIKEIGISHIIFGFNFSPIRADIDRIIEITKQLSKFARQ
jgi:hypothetical protein